MKKPKQRSNDSLWIKHLLRVSDSYLHRQKEVQLTRDFYRIALIFALRASIQQKSRPCEKKVMASCGEAPLLRLWPLVHQFCQALSQAFQVTDFDVQNLYDSPNFNLRLLLLLSAGSQRFFSTLNTILQLNVPPLQVLQTHSKLLVNLFYNTIIITSVFVSFQNSITNHLLIIFAKHLKCK